MSVTSRSPFQLLQPVPVHPASWLALSADTASLWQTVGRAPLNWYEVQRLQSLVHSRALPNWIAQPAYNLLRSTVEI